MRDRKGPNYSEALIKRLELLIELSGLELVGFSEFTSVSESHLYAILNGTRDMTGNIAERIAGSFGLKSWQLLKLDYKLPKKIRRIQELNKFYDENKNVAGYFRKDKADWKVSFFFEDTLLKKTRIFNNPIYVYEVKLKCAELGKTYSSKKISQVLNYLVEKGKLRKEKRPLRLISGSYGNRKVYVYFKQIHQGNN